MIKNCKFKILLLIYYAIVVLDAATNFTSTKNYRNTANVSVNSFGLLELKSLSKMITTSSAKTSILYRKPTPLDLTTTDTYLIVKPKTLSPNEISINETAHTFKRLNDISEQPLPPMASTAMQVSVVMTTSTKVTTTTSVAKMPIYAHILDFKLITSSFKPETNAIELGYIINANITSMDSSILVDIEINCSCSKTNQTWNKLMQSQRIFNKTSYLSATMSPRIQPIPGSFLLCQATATNINLKEQNFTNYQSFSLIYLLIDPLPATSLVIKSVNSTSLELNWQNPIYFYDSLQIVCYLNEDVNVRNEPYLNQTILNNQPDFVSGLDKPNQFLSINNLKPGGKYNCTIYTVRYENEEFFSTVKSQTVKEMTKLSYPKINENNVETSYSSISFKLKPPEGYYDFFTVDLVDLQKPAEISMTQNFSFNSLESNGNEFKVIFSDSSKTKILPGHIYELGCTVVKENMSNRMTISQSFALKPDEVPSLNTYILSKSQLLVTWPSSNLTSNNRNYLINLYLDKNLVFTTKTEGSRVTLNSLNPALVYLVSIQVCISHKIDCDTTSLPTSLKFRINQNLLSYVQMKKTDTNIRENSTGILVEWSLTYKLNASELCDISTYHLSYSNINSLSQTQTNCIVPALTPQVLEYFANYKCSSEFNEVNETKDQLKICSDLDAITCSSYSKLTHGFKCVLKISNLNFNTIYNVSIGIKTKNGQYERPNTERLIKTNLNVPPTKTKLKSSLELSAKISNGNMISLIEPFVDQKNGPILNAYLFLVKLDMESHLLNQTNKTHFAFDVNDQLYLKNLIEASEYNLCKLNETKTMDPCMLKNYTRQENQFNNSDQRRLVFVGQLMESLNEFLPNLTTYENITTNFIEPNNFYQFFYAFKIGEEAMAKSSFRSIKRANELESEYIYYATDLTDPIHAKRAVSGSIMSSLKKGDGLAVWIIIVTSIISSLLLITFIAILVVLILTRYKPSKFHKAAQAIANNHNPGRLGNIGSSLSMRINNKMSMDKCVDEFMGLSNDFVLPGEFSRHQMTNIWLVKHANGDLILGEEYSNLPDYRDRKTCFASELLKNENKNRFLDIKAYDDSRVVLDNGTNNNNSNSNNKIATSQNSVCEKSILASMSTSTSSNNSQYNEMLGDYINANFVQGFSHDKKFIATQGPKKETIVDFWRMIFQYRISAIVMLTKLVERGVERCTQYWPEKLNISETYGDFEVTMKDQQKCGDYIKRTFDLVNLNYTNIAAASTHTTTTMASTPGSLSIHNTRVLSVVQYYYGEWPDKEEPSTDPISILHLIRDVNQNHMSYQYPIVVHCSAGVGRTGTYITLDAMMEKINTESKIDIYGFISKIRERRQYLVQTAKQYIFIHEALYEYCLYGFTDIEPIRLVSHYKYLKELSPVNSHGLLYTNKTNKTRLQIEFDKLSTAFAPNSQAREAMSNENRNRNRNLEIICFDDNRIKLSSLNGSSYINATKIKGYELTHSEFIITQDPLPNTVFEFWKMIFEYDCNVVVALNKDYERESYYWPSEKNPIVVSEVDDHKYVIQLISKTPVKSEKDVAIKECDDFLTRRQFEITETKYSSTSKLIITHFVFNETWLEDKVPPSRTNFINLVNQVQKAASDYNRTCVAVHAYGGGSNCSVFCALSILLDQYKNDQYVDVCRSVKKIKSQRPHMIESYEQYEFLYLCLVDFVEMFGTYFSNDSINSQMSFE